MATYEFEGREIEGHEVDAMVREDAPFWVISQRRARGQSKSLHIPKHENRNDPDPVCRTSGSLELEWTDKDIAVFPPRYRDVCDRCRKYYLRYGVPVTL